MQSNFHSLISAAVGNYSWLESSHPFVPEDKKKQPLLPSRVAFSHYLFLYRSVLVSVSDTVSLEKGNQETNDMFPITLRW